MYADKKYAKKLMNEAQLIGAVFQKHTVKHLAQAMDAPIATARSWLYRSFSPTRRRELARALLEEFDRQDREERPLVRAALIEMAGGKAIVGQRSEVAGASVGLGDQSDHEAVGRAAAAQDRPPARGVR